MKQRRNFLILNNNPNEMELLYKLCQNEGAIQFSSDLEKAIAHLKTTNFEVLVVAYTLAHYSFLKGIFKATTSVLITGIEEMNIKEIVKGWPSDLYVDYHLTPLHREDNEGFLRTLNRAAEHSILKSEIERLGRTLERTDIELKEAYSEIKDIKMLISESDARELEKRIAIEKKYISFQQEKQKIEEIVRKLYAANDVTSLLDIVSDMKDIVQAESITMYILDKSEAHGEFLKPLVWENAFIPDSSLTKYIAPIDSQDFATSVVQYVQEINVSDLSYDKRLSRRYLENLKTPPKNLLCVPIMHEKDVIGALEVYNRTHRGRLGKNGFTKSDQQTLRRFSEHIAIAISKLNLIQYDALTSLLRPDPFFDKILQNLKSTSKKNREKESYAMVMSDVDWFKDYNDKNGHEAGNRLLRELANVLKSPIREEDLLCRYGGEEFLFFLSGIKDMEEALHLTERIRKNVEEHYFERQEFQPRNNLTMSFGVAHFTWDYLDSLMSINKNELKKIINESDMALSRAKGKLIGDSIEMEEEMPMPVKNTICAFYRTQLDESDDIDVIRPYKETFPQEKRKFERFYASTILIYTVNNSHNVTKTINLSEEGAKIHSESQLPKGQTLDLILILGNKVCQLKSEVVYSEKAHEESSVYHSGLRFKNLSVKDRKILEDYFASLRNI